MGKKLIIKCKEIINFFGIQGSTKFTEIDIKGNQISFRKSMIAIYSMKAEFLEQIDAKILCIYTYMAYQRNQHFKLKKCICDVIVVNLLCNLADTTVYKIY
jgi:hypothetical protein